MQCIFCLQEITDKNSCREHIIPKSIGGSWTTNSVCKTCNSDFGQSVDSLIIDHALIIQKRREFDLAGNTGKIPALFNQGKMGDNYEFDIEIQHGRNGKIKQYFIRPQGNISGPEHDLKLRCIMDEKLERHATSILRQKASELGCKISEEQLGEISFRKALLDSGIAVDIPIDAKNYNRGLLKIAYETTHEWLGKKYLSDPTGKLIKEIVMDAERFDSLEQIFPGGILSRLNPQQKGLFGQWRNSPNCHVIFLDSFQDALICHIRLFSVIEGLIRVSNQPQAYRFFEPTYLICDPTTRKFNSHLFDTYNYKRLWHDMKLF